MFGNYFFLKISDYITYKKLFLFKNFLIILLIKNYSKTFNLIGFKEYQRFLWQNKRNNIKKITKDSRRRKISVYQWFQKTFQEIRSNGGSASTRLCIGPYMVASRMAVYRESSKEAESITTKHIRVLYVFACWIFLLSLFLSSIHTLNQ